MIYIKKQGINNKQNYKKYCSNNLGEIVFPLNEFASTVN